MNVLKLLPIILGGAGVLQSTLNKAIAETNGLSMAALINGVVVALCGAFVFMLIYCLPGHFPDIAAYKGKGQMFQWWYLFPGIIGFSLVFTIPLVVMEEGALAVFLGVIAGQIIVSFLWDTYCENMPLNGTRLAGALLTFIGALLVVWKK